MSISFDEARKRLQNDPAKYAFKAALLELVSQTSLDAAEGFSRGRVTVLYSGYPVADTKSDAIIKAMIDNGEDVRLIDKSQAAKLLLSDEFLAAVGKLDGLSLAQMKSDDPFPIKDWLFSPDPDDGPWAANSKRFAAETAGEVLRKYNPKNKLMSRTI